MTLIQVMILVFPLFNLAPETPEHVLAAGDQVNMKIAAAVSVAAEYQPAWELDVYEVLEKDPEYAERLVKAIRRYSKESGLEAAMLWSVAYTETRGSHWTKRGNVKRGGAGEIGLMQIMPSWKKSLKRVYDLEVDLYHLEDNMHAATVILKRGGDDPDVMLSYYNTGQRVHNTRYQRAVKRYWNAINERQEQLVSAGFRTADSE